MHPERIEVLNYKFFHNPEFIYRQRSYICHLYVLRMSEIKEDFPLINYNTFHVAASSRFFVECNDIPSVRDFLSSTPASVRPVFVLGGGSNVLFTKDFNGLIIHPVIKGIVKTGEKGGSVRVSVGAGEEWDGFVQYCVNREWGGIENLSMIPGTVGAAPVQNIGAYGVEVMEFIESVEGYQISNGKELQLSAKECRFTYRDSIFKRELKDQLIITRVNFRLSKNHSFNTDYPDLKKELNNYSETTLKSIREVVMAIRSNKLPDPSLTGNAGSFFKNPVIRKEQANSLLSFYPYIPLYGCAEGRTKLSAAWLIDQCGWKGKRWGKAGTHKKQPLIIVNHGGATGEEILQCALKIQKAVMNKFAIKLEMEINIL